MGLGDQGNGAISVYTLDVSDRKPNEIVSSKTESAFVKKQGSPSKWNRAQRGRSQWDFLSSNFNFS